MARSVLVLLLAFCLLAVAVNAKKSKGAKKSEHTEADQEPEQDEAKNNESENEEVNNDENAAAHEEKEQEAAPEEHDKDKEGEETKEPHEEEAETKEADETKETGDEEENTLENEQPVALSAFKCNLKYQRVGCYKDSAKKDRPLRNFIMTNAKLGLTQKKSGGKTPSAKDFDSALPEFACKCANEALDRGQAVFGIQNLAECWSGPDNSKFDADGPSNDCVTFGYKECLRDSQVCAGKKHANFVYFVDSPDHTKSPEEAKKEWAQIKKAQKKLAEQRRKAAEKAAKAKGKKSKKGKKSSKKHH